MASINTQPMGSFRYLLGDSLKTLPRIYFNPDVAEIATAVNAIGDAIEIRTEFSTGQNDETENAIARQVFESYDKLKLNPEFSSCFHPLSKLANNIGESIVGIFNLLRTSVRPEVEALRESVDARMAQLMDQENLTATVTPNTEINTDYTIMDWDSIINSQGGVAVLTSAISEYLNGYTPTAGMNDLTVLLNSSLLVIKDLAIDPDTAADIQSRVSQRLSPTTDVQVVRDIMELVTSPYAFDRLVASHLRAALTTTDYASLLIKLMSVIVDFYPVVEVFKSTPLNVSDELLDDIQNNIEVLKKFTTICAYLILVMRNHYSGALVIDAKMLNGDTVEEFTNAGGTFEDISKYLQAFYFSGKKNIPIPFRGIAGADIIEKKETANAEYTQMAQTHLLQASSIRHAVMARALKSVLTDHIQSASSSRMPEQMSIDEFYHSKKHLVQRAMNRLDITEDQHLDNILYDFVLTLWYDGSMVKTAHELFGTEIIRQMEATSDLDSETLALVDARVAAAICANFLVKEILVVK